MPDRKRSIQGQIIFGSDQGRVEDPKCTGEGGEVRYAPNKAALEPIFDTHEVFLKTENRQLNQKLGYLQRRSKETNHRIE